MFARDRRRKNSRSKSATYCSLEERRYLAVSTVFEAGELTIFLEADNDEAVLSKVGDEIRVNGEAVDTNVILDGVQPLLIGNLTDLIFVGTEGLQDLAVTLECAFSTGGLQTMRFENIQFVTLSGVYTTGQLTGTFSGDGGSFSGTGQITVTNQVDLQSDDDFDFILSNQQNDFMGTVSIDTGGNIELVDSDGNLVLQNVAARNMKLDAQGTITNTVDPNIIVPGASNFTAEVVNLGNNGGVVDLFAVISNTNSTFSLNEFDNFIWSNQSTVGFANIAAGGLVSMGPNANITVNGDALFDVDRLRIGVGGSNTFNAGRININAVRNAFVSENSSTLVFGQNSAADLDLFSSGDLTNDTGAVLNVEGIASFQTPSNVSIGNQEGDQFNAGQLRFFASEVNFSEDSGAIIGGLANRAVNLTVEANGLIQDTPNAFTFVVENATFVSMGESTGVTIGDTSEDLFRAGSVSFAVPGGTFILSENDGVNILSEGGFVNDASNVNILAQDGSVLNEPDSIINVTGNATFRSNGGSVSVGQMPGDSVQLGLVSVVATNGNAAINLEGDVVFANDTNVGMNLTVNSVNGVISDLNSNITVNGLTTLVAPMGITVGDQNAPDDSFTTGTLRFVSNGGNVDISQNSTMVLTGVNNAMTLRLETAGNDPFDITNEAGLDLNVAENLFVTATGGVDLGSGVGDSVNFNNLNFSAATDVAITAIFADENDEIFLFGSVSNPNESDEFRLTTNVDVFDGANTFIDVDSFFRIESRNVILGDSDTDCVMIPEDSEFVTSDNLPDVTTDETCP